MSFKEEKEATFLFHEPCPKCGSKDNLARYDDGHGYCFGCQYYEKGEGQPGEPEPKQVNGALIRFTPTELTKRRISEDTCRKWGYGVAQFDGKNVQVATYTDSQGNPVAQKLRFPNKDFIILGDIKSAVLYGQNLWRDTGKMVIVTEGEIDALSVSEIQSNKWPVVSIPTGASGAVKAIKKSLDWLQTFESVILMFDNDEPGQEAARKCAELFAPGKCKIASLPSRMPTICWLRGAVAR
jgi:twinkle protein